MNDEYTTWSSYSEYCQYARDVLDEAGFTGASIRGGAAAVPAGAPGGCEVVAAYCESRREARGHGAEGPAVRELTAGELLSADLAADVGDRPERLRGPCVAGDGLSWFAYTGGELPAVGTFATREAAVAYALGAGALDTEEAAELRDRLDELDRTWARGPEGGLDEPPDPSPAADGGDEEERAARL